MPCFEKLASRRSLPLDTCEGAASLEWMTKPELPDRSLAGTSAIISPQKLLAFNSGLLSSSKAAQTLIAFNPIFYLIDGFRYGFIGRAEGNLAIGVTLTGVLTLALGWTCLWMFRVGYKIKT